MKIYLGVAVLLASVSAAFAQPVVPAYQFQQPIPSSGRLSLSPYLNLLNGANPALNYYYGVRPMNLPQQVPSYPGGTSSPSFSSAAPSLFFRPVAPKELDDTPGTKQKFLLPPPGSPVSFGNSFGNSRAGLNGGAGGQNSQSGAGTPTRR
jgi:hypothetical protein